MGAGSFLISNNQFSLRGRKRLTGQSLYYPRVMMRTLAQVLTEEYSEHGVHVANVVIDGLIDSPGTRALPRAQQHPEAVMNPVKIAEAFYYLHTQDRSCWTHELQLTPFVDQAELLSDARCRGLIMDHVEFDHEPPANLTTLVMAFGGWIDAGQAATGALRQLVRDLPAARLASIDPEEFFVFTQERPEVRLRPDGGRDIHWPRSEFFAWAPGRARTASSCSAARSRTSGGTPIRRRSSTWPSAAG